MIVKDRLGCTGANRPLVRAAYSFGYKFPRRCNFNGTKT